MIYSASYKNDMPAFQAGDLVDFMTNVMNPEEDFIVFWTKNPLPLMREAGELLIKTPCYFQYTVNPYGRDVEPFVLDGKTKVATMRELSAMIGRDRIVWRYDPILISEKYSVEYHKKWFAGLYNRVRGLVGEVKFSFVDEYTKIADDMASIGGRAPTTAEELELAKFISETVNGECAVTTCAELINLDEFGITHGACINPAKINRIRNSMGLASIETTAQHSRKGCNCCHATDIGVYNTCKHGCKYCYACNHKKEV